MLEEPQRSNCLPMGCSCRQRRVTVPLLGDSPCGWQSSSCPQGRFSPSQEGELGTLEVPCLA